MHRYPTRFSAMNRSFFPAASSADDADYDPADDVYDESDDYDAYAAANPYKGYRPPKNDDDEEYVPETTKDADDSYDAYCASTGFTYESYGDDDDEYVVNLKGWHTGMGCRPVTRSLTRGVGIQTRVMTLRSSRR